MTSAQQPVTYGLDGSNNNPGLSIAAAVTQGYDFFMWKITEGDDFYDGTFEAARAEAEKAGALFAAYHALHKGNARAQAEWVARHLTDKSIPVMIDDEPFVGGGRPGKRDAVIFAAHGAKLGFKVTMDYLPFWYWLSFKFLMRGLPALVSSNYVNGRGHGSELYPGDTWAGWQRYGGRKPIIGQFTSKGVIDGYNGFVDLDAFRGTRAQLASLGLFKDYAPTPPAPGPKPPKPQRHPWWHIAHLEAKVARLQARIRRLTGKGHK